MVVEFVARHFHAPADLREYAEEEIKKFEKYHDKITQCQLILNHEHHEHIAEINLSIPGNIIFEKAVSNNMTKSIDKAVSKATQQLQKHLDLHYGHR